MKEKIIKGLLKCFAMLPLGILYIVSDIIIFLLYHVIKYRRNVVNHNLKTSFPQKSGKEIKQIEKKFYRYLGDQIVETLKLLHISDENLKKRVEVTNYEPVNQSLSAHRNAVLLLGHYCNWEWVQEITRYFIPQSFMVSIYHPLKNKMWDQLFLDIRSRWGAHIIPMYNTPRTLLNKANQPWVCGFIADAWTINKHEDNWIEFLNHKTWFIYGPEEIGRKVGADFFYLEMNRKKRGFYKITFHKLEPSDMSQPFPYIREFWKEFEKTIVANPPYWLWSHKRWK